MIATHSLSASLCDGIPVLICEGIPEGVMLLKKFGWIIMCFLLILTHSFVKAQVDLLSFLQVISPSQKLPFH